MARSIHAVMQDSNDGNAVKCDAKINHVSLNIVAAIAWPDMIASRGNHWRACQLAKGGGRYVARVPIYKPISGVIALFRILVRLFVNRPEKRTGKISLFQVIQDEPARSRMEGNIGVFPPLPETFKWATRDVHGVTSRNGKNRTLGRSCGFVTSELRVLLLRH